MMNILKSITVTVSTLAISSLLGNAQEPQVSAYLMQAGKAPERVLVIGSNSAGNVFYKESANAVKTVRAPIGKFTGIWLFEPKEVTAAKDLFEARKYEEAKEAFIAIQARYKNYKYLDDSYFELGQFYEMECYRKLKDYSTLSKKLELYNPAKLTRPAQAQQTKLYRMYDAVHKKDWSRLNNLCQDYIQDNGITLSQRAQIAFCQGLAYEGLRQNNDALNLYATAMTADFTRSESIVRDAALNSLRIFAADEEIETAMSLWETEDEDKDSVGYRKLQEANALARLYDKAGYGSGVELPANYKKFQEFTSASMLEKIKAKAK